MGSILQFISRLVRRHDGTPPDVPIEQDETNDPDEAVLNQLRAVGSDLRKPTHILFYVYAPTEAGAQRIAERGVDSLLHAEVRPAASGDGTWLCLFEGNLVPEPQMLRQYRARFEALAAAENGDYDGWEAAVAQ